MSLQILPWETPSAGTSVVGEDDAETATVASEATNLATSAAAAASTTTVLYEPSEDHTKSEAAPSIAASASATAAVSSNNPAANTFGNPSVPADVQRQPASKQLKLNLDQPRAKPLFPPGSTAAAVADHAAACFCGVVFGIGLALSGLASPDRVLG
jgi:hypothetical protein